MFTQQVIHVRKGQRQQKRNKSKQKRTWWITPPKSVRRQFLDSKVSQKCQKFGYDYQPGQSRTLKYMKDQFIWKSVQYLRGDQKPKTLKTKDKYETNLRLGKPMKKNPLIKIFNKLENKLNRIDKLIAFQAIRQQAF